jgi:hypothetical protein
MIGIFAVRAGLQVGPIGSQFSYSDTAEGSAIHVSGTLAARRLRQKVSIIICYSILVEALCYKHSGFDSR